MCFCQCSCLDYEDPIQRAVCRECVILNTSVKVRVLHWAMGETWFELEELLSNPSLSQFIPCVYNPPKKGHWFKQAKHSNLLRAWPSLYLVPAFQQCLRGAAGRKLARHWEDERRQAENLHAGRNKMDIKDGLNCREDFSCQRLMETFSHNTERGMEAPLSQQSRWSWQPFQRRAEMCIVAQLSALSQPLRPLPE